MMNWWKKQAKAVLRVLLCFIWLILLIGCGSTSSVPPKSTIVASPPISTDKGVDTAKLFHIEGEPVDCTFDPFFQDRGNLVPKVHPDPYDSGELQQLESYMRKLGAGNPEAPLPSTLDRLQGGSFCRGGLQITNISQNTIQIKSINMRVTSTPVLNTTHYDLIDTCSLLSGAERVGCPGSFGGGPPNVYTYDLEKALAGSLILPQNFEPLVLQPSDPPAYIAFFFSSHGSPDNFVYTLAPELALTTGSMKLETNTMKIVLADKKQFACVQLSKNTFVPESSIPSSHLPDGSPSGHWCV